MLISPPEAMPIRRVQWQLRQPHQVNRSGWTGRRQVSPEPGAAMWGCSVEFRPLITPARAKSWRGFFTSLNGQVNHFPVIAVEGVQHGAGNPNVTVGAAGANQVTLSSAIGLARGDMMTVKLVDGTYQLVCLSAAMAGGVATFMPPLRAAAATGPGSVETVQPFAYVTLSDDTVGWDVDIGQRYGFSFSAEEFLG